MASYHKIAGVNGMDGLHRKFWTSLGVGILVSYCSPPVSAQQDRLLEQVQQRLREGLQQLAQEAAQGGTRQDGDGRAAESSNVPPGSSGAGSAEQLPPPLDLGAPLDVPPLARPQTPPPPPLPQFGSGPDPAGSVSPASAAESGAYLGVQLSDVSGTRLRRGGVPVTRGAEVTSVTPGSPADQAGIKSGHVIVSIDQQVVQSPDQVAEFVQRSRPGQVVRVGFYDDGRLIQRQLTLTGRPGSNVTVASQVSGPPLMLGNPAGPSAIGSPELDALAEAMEEELVQMNGMMQEMRREIVRLQQRVEQLERATAAAGRATPPVPPTPRPFGSGVAGPLGAARGGDAAPPGGRGGDADEPPADRGPLGRLRRARQGNPPPPTL
jgi:type II secretory pathway pseudopilin PulG